MRVVLAFLFLIGLSAQALQIPKRLTKADRQEVVETLGIGTATKMLTNPFPLGGYSGFELGYSVEFINVQDINRLGCTPGVGTCPNKSVSDEGEFRYSRFSIGKGLFHDIDIFLNFSPPFGGSNISDYGGSIRWAFYQAAFLPITFSFIVHGNRTNIQNDFINQNFGAEIIAGITLDNFALYAGGGQIWGKGTFLVSDTGNGTVDPTDPDVNGTNMVHESVRQPNTVVGISLRYENLFAAAEINHYGDSVYSGKLGVRF